MVAWADAPRSAKGVQPCQGGDRKPRARYVKPAIIAPRWGISNDRRAMRDLATGTENPTAGPSRNPL